MTITSAAMTVTLITGSRYVSSMRMHMSMHIMHMRTRITRCAFSYLEDRIDAVQRKEVHERARRVLNGARALRHRHEILIGRRGRVGEADGIHGDRHANVGQLEQQANGDQNAGHEPRLGAVAVVRRIPHEEEDDEGDQREEVEDGNREDQRLTARPRRLDEAATLSARLEVIRRDRVDRPEAESEAPEDE